VNSITTPELGSGYAIAELEEYLGRNGVKADPQYLMVKKLGAWAALQSSLEADIPDPEYAADKIMNYVEVSGILEGCDDYAEAYEDAHSSLYRTAWDIYKGKYGSVISDERYQSLRSQLITQTAGLFSQLIMDRRSADPNEKLLARDYRAESLAYLRGAAGRERSILSAIKPADDVLDEGWESGRRIAEFDPFPGLDVIDRDLSPEMRQVALSTPEALTEKEYQLLYGVIVDGGDRLPTSPPRTFPDAPLSALEYDGDFHSLYNNRVIIAYDREERHRAGVAPAQDLYDLDADVVRRRRNPVLSEATLKQKTRTALSSGRNGRIGRSKKNTRK
jgi:hypothetical protein